ncbi:MAG: hypothetical protein JO002_12070 [Burkholderiaceae bacterium]|nr:hypothetical protein [Burkholderiaceae bacterium]
MASRTYKLFMEARRAAQAAAGRLEDKETGELVPEGGNAWTWAHSRAFAGARFAQVDHESASGTGARLGPAGRS